MPSIRALLVAVCDKTETIADRGLYVNPTWLITLFIGSIKPFLNSRQNQENDRYLTKNHLELGAKPTQSNLKKS